MERNIKMSLATMLNKFNDKIDELENFDESFITEDTDFKSLSKEVRSYLEELFSSRLEDFVIDMIDNLAHQVHSKYPDYDVEWCAVEETYQDYSECYERMARILTSVVMNDLFYNSDK
jgi:hypothetical protein